jgi:hypothetical protein
MKKPDFFIVGVPKCGTTTMHNYLKQHPEIFLPELKELHCFGADFHRINHTPYTKEQYLSFFTGAKNKKRIGDASTSYLHSSTAALEIKEFNPSAKIIIMLRNPVDVMYAYHHTNLYGGFEYIADFEEALNAEDKRKRGLCWPDRSGILECLFYREVVRYSKHIRRYFKIFDRENIHIIIFDDFKNDTAGIYKQALCFLGVNSNFCTDFRIIKPDKSLWSVAVQNFLLSPPHIVKSFSHMIIPDNLRQTLVSSLRRLNTTNAPRPPMDTELRRRLQAEFAPEVERLSELLGRDLTHWSRD